MRKTFSDLTGKSTDEIGIISSIPTDAKIIMFPIAGAFLDGWKNTKDINLTQVNRFLIVQRTILPITIDLMQVH